MKFQFKVQLKGVIMPPVWRQFEIPAEFSFDQFHKAIQLALGWEDKHPYSFSPKGPDSETVIMKKDQSEDALDAEVLRLEDYFSAGQKLLVYTYDFKEDWQHVIHLEKITPGTSDSVRLIAGKGACPPEGCGGIWGFQRIKDFVRDSDNPDWHEVMWEMFGYLVEEGYDPDRFNLESVQSKLDSFEF